MKINATMGLSFPSDGSVNITITDKDSRIEFVDLSIDYREFTALLSTLQDRPVECEVRGLKHVGKLREQDQVKMYCAEEMPSKWGPGGEKEARSALVKKAVSCGLGDGGWSLSANSAISSQGGQGTDEKGKWYMITRHRFVKNPNIKEDES
jgi:hypothetical protein